ncbi:hypothetical protein [Undibacterium sp. TS12]|uniref:hypothetical protein n=1 Tax=Undibacterium sp. TS12 TaxID=2908202 RepID=UPI001F4C633D|nr:hypothetical protein [Undibacterium sp. TS12]MCH8622550.1 hypothetical protein [Undibacterium sp. TS12]
MTNQKCLDFVKWFEDVLDTRPGILGSVADISAMFYVVDNINNLLLFDERLPPQLSWNAFLIEKKLFRDLRAIPVEENWDFERFVELRHQYLKWIEDRRADSSSI